MILGIIRLGNGDYISPEHLKFIEMSLRIRCSEEPVLIHTRYLSSTLHLIKKFYSVHLFTPELIVTEER